MAKNAKITLAEARASGQMKKFIRTHDLKPDPEVRDPKGRFERLLEAMAKPRSSPEDDQT